VPATLRRDTERGGLVQVTWWWLWDVFILLVLMAGAVDHLANKKAGLAALSVSCCWLAFFRLLSSYGAW
jgi:hypothetical protein